MADKYISVKAAKDLAMSYIEDDELCAKACEDFNDLPAADVVERISDFNSGAFDTLNVLSAAYWGKQYYFAQDNGIVYSRDSGKCMTLDDAITEFANKIGDDGSI